MTAATETVETPTEDPVETTAIDAFEAGPANLGTGPTIDTALATALGAIIHGPTKVVASKVVYSADESAKLKTDAAKIRAHLLSVLDTDTESVRLIIRDVDGGQSFAFKLGKARKKKS